MTSASELEDAVDGATMTPRDDLAQYLTRFHHEMAATDEDPAAILDRYCTSDFEHWSDGLRLDRDRLIAHARPARKNVTRIHTEVQDVVVSSERAAARYTLSGTMRGGRAFANEVYMFGTFAPDGRLRRIDQITRVLPDP